MFSRKYIFMVVLRTLGRSVQSSKQGQYTACDQMY